MRIGAHCCRFMSVRPSFSIHVSVLVDAFGPMAFDSAQSYLLNSLEFFRDQAFKDKVIVSLTLPKAVLSIDSNSE